MNKRLLLSLYDRSGLGAYMPVDFKGHELQVEEHMKKFAQLIVRECLSTLNDMHLWQSVNNQNYPNSWHDAVDQGIDTIKEHFGVE